MEKICPKCGYERKEVDTAPDYECPMCGIIYDKFKNQNKDIIENGNAIEVTENEFAKVIVYSITQIQLEPNNMQNIANNIGFSFPKLFKRKFWIFQYELICLFLAIAQIATKEYLNDKPDSFESIIRDVFDLLYKISFDDSSDNWKHQCAWTIKTGEKCDEYIDLVQPWDSNSIPLMAHVFLKNIPKIQKPLEARIFMSTYIQDSYFSFSDALNSYKLMGAEERHTTAKI